MGILKDAFGTGFFDTNKNGKLDPQEKLTETLFTIEVERRKRQKEQERKKGQE